MKRLWISLISYLIVFNIFGQKQAKLPFRAGEELVYTASYSMFVLNVEVGEVVLKVADTTINGQYFYHLNSTGRTYIFYDPFFKVRDKYETWITPDDFKPHIHSRMVREGNYRLDTRYDFNWDTKKIIYKTKRMDDPERTDSIDIRYSSLDIVSLVYKARSIRFEKMNVGDSVTLDLVIDQKLEKIKVKYLGTDFKESDDIGVFKCHLISVSMLKGMVFEEGNKLKVWITDDNNHIPIWIESPIIVGKVRLKLVGYSNLRFPPSSLIP